MSDDQMTGDDPAGDPMADDDANLSFVDHEATTAPALFSEEAQVLISELRQTIDEGRTVISELRALIDGAVGQLREIE